MVVSVLRGFAVPAALCASRFRGWRSWGRRRGRQGGQGLGARSHATLNRGLDGRIRRALHQDCSCSSPLEFIRSLPGHAHMPATPATDRAPSPCPPSRCCLTCLGTVSVSRPIEGLDSHGAVRTLRMRRPLARGRTRSVREGQLEAERKAARFEECGRHEAVEPLDGARHASTSKSTCAARQGGRGLGSQARPARCGRTSQTDHELPSAAHQLARKKLTG